MIGINDFIKVEMRAGKVEEASGVEGSQKLIRLLVNFGPTSPEATLGVKDEVRTIFTGVRKWYEPEYFVGKTFTFVTNLEPKIMPSFAPNGATKGKGEESQGMILTVDGPDSRPVFIAPTEEVSAGAKVR